MTRWAIGDIQGCCEEFEQLLGTINFHPDRDRLWLVGDLVNRGPCSLQVLRKVRSLGERVVCVLGNHDLHLLAVALGGAKPRRNDTLAQVLDAPDRDELLDWLLHRPLAHHERIGDGGDLLVHAGVVPDWDLRQTLSLAQEVEQALRGDARTLLEHLYGDRPRRWRDSLRGVARLRFAVNVLTRLRFCTADGRVDLAHKGKPDSVQPPLLPWFCAPRRLDPAIRVVFGHWSALGYYRAPGVLGLDSGCVWGGVLTAVNLDVEQPAPVTVPSRQPRSIEA